MDKPILPITLKVRAVRPGSQLEVDGVLTDAAGANIRSVSLTMSHDTTAAAACAILQAHVTQVAKSMHVRGDAQLRAAEASAEDDAAALAALVGREFTGSVAP